MNNRISILIITKNRAQKLSKCLESLSFQTIKPFEVIIVDNASVDQTRAICSHYQNELNIKYYYEKRIGMPYARNLSLEEAKGQIFAFIDDDCVADKKWLETIINHFIKNPKSDGVIGYSDVLHKKNFASIIEQIFYERKLVYYIGNLHLNSRVSCGDVVDFKNAAFKKSFIKKFRFKIIMPFGEDIELGYRLCSKSRELYYDPKVIVTHENSLTFSRLFKKNFKVGYSMQLLRTKYGINTNVSVNEGFVSRIKYLRKEIRLFKSNSKITDIALILLYTIVYRIGKLFGFLIYPRIVL